MAHCLDMGQIRRTNTVQYLLNDIYYRFSLTQNQSKGII